MDIRCPVCGEPWDMDCIHEEVEYRYPDKPWYNADGKYNQQIYDTYYKPTLREFGQKGCEALTAFGGTHNELSKDDNSAKLSSMLFDVLGDDIDGIASELDDAEYLGLI